MPYFPEALSMGGSKVRSRENVLDSELEKEGLESVNFGESCDAFVSLSLSSVKWG